jgi:hypothetical protein
MKHLSKWFVASLLIAGSLAMQVESAQAQVRRYITFTNGCRFNVRFYVSHADGWRNWHVHGPFEFAAWDGPRRLEANGITLTQTENHDLYVYAEDSRGGTWEGDHVYEYQGTMYRMMRATTTVSGGELRVRLTCDN